MTAFTSAFEVTKVSKGDSTLTSVQIALEMPYTIVSNGIDISTLMCSPSDIKELTFGFLYNSGFINSSADISSFNLNEDKCIIDVSLKIYINAKNLNDTKVLNTGVKQIYTTFGENNFSPLDFDFRVEKEKISDAIKWFQFRSVIFKSTKGVHFSALSLKGEMPEKIFEDVARHNAVDKVTGNALMRQFDFSKSLLFCSCRISSEILNKAIRCKIPFVISFHSPTHQAILLAKKMNVTLIGNLKMNGFIIYNCADRVID